MSNHYDVIIIGAGAAGLMCAIEAGKRGRKVLLLEKADQAGRKILVSGGGRCNFTNLYTEPAAYLSGNPHFCKSALARYTPWAFMELMQAHGLSWAEKTQGQLFCDQKAGAILEMLLAECYQHHVKLKTAVVIGSINKSDQKHGQFEVHSSSGGYYTHSLVVATGGPSIPKMGATDFGLQIAEQFGVKYLPFRAALVPFTFSKQQMDDWFSGLSGVAFPVQVSCGDASFRENLLITHRGLSGPAMLQISSYWAMGQTLVIDLLPGVNSQTWLLEKQQQSPNAELKTVLSTVLPKRFAQRLCEREFRTDVLKQYSQLEIAEIASVLNGWQLQPAGTEGMRTAEVSLGGVETSELSSKTFACQSVPDL
jgi:predicted Rossmann fold flavoprotein